MNPLVQGGLRSKAHALAQFFMAQGLAMAANLLYGLLCVRLLPSSEYAKFVVVFGVQGSLLGIMDANLSGTLIPLIGERVDNRELIADYVASLRQLALGAYFVVCTGFVLFFPFMVKNRHWSRQTVVAMVGILLVSTWSFRVSTIYGAVMIMLRDRSHWYRGQLISALGTLALLLAACAFHVLGALQAILFNVVGMLFVSRFYSARARKLLAVKGQASREKRKAIIRLALPNMPGAFFYALQGQLPLYLITFLGRTAGVASIGALGRLSQIFSILQQANPLLLEPYFAKLPKARLKKAYSAVLVLSVVVCCAFLVLAIAVPRLFLWVLGPQYAGLVLEVRLVVASGSLGYINGVLWSIHSARRFVFWWSVAASIALTFFVQMVFVVFADMSTVRALLWMNIAMNAVAVFISLLCGMWGFARGPREAERLPANDTVESVEADAVLSSGRLQNVAGKP